MPCKESGHIHDWVDCSRQPNSWIIQGDHLSGKPGNVGIWQLSGKCRGFYWKSGKCRGIVKEKNLVREKLPKQIVNCIFVSIQVFSRSLLCLKSIWFRIMYCCIPAPTTDSNTSTGMIWVTLNMPSAVKECREPSGNFTLSGKCSPWIDSLANFNTMNVH